MEGGCCVECEKKRDSTIQLHQFLLLDPKIASIPVVVTMTPITVVVTIASITVVVTIASITVVVTITSITLVVTITFITLVVTIASITLGVTNHFYNSSNKFFVVRIRL